MDFAWDVFLALGAVLFAVNMWRHARFGRPLAVSGGVIAVALLVMNLAVFPDRRDTTRWISGRSSGFVPDRDRSTGDVRSLAADHEVPDAWAESTHSALSGASSVCRNPAAPPERSWARHPG
jgi:hypothetical protein